MYKFVVLLFLTCIVFTIAPPVQAVSFAPITEPQVVYIYGQELLFQASFSAPKPVSSVTVFWQVSGDEHTQQAPAAYDGAKVTYRQDLRDIPLPPFATVLYWFGVTYTDGELAASEKYAFLYSDNRFNWNSLEQDGFTFNWIDGDLSFSQQAIDSLRSGRERIRSIFPAAVANGENIRVVVYPSATHVQEALQLSGQDWVAGHADPELGVVLASIPTGDRARVELERQLPHELMHVLLVRWIDSTDGNYRNLPVWLNEGLASLAEISPNSDYPSIIQQAQEHSNLLPMPSLCLNFPSDSSAAILAYAQSATFTRYLSHQFGASGLQKLVQAYADGLECERGAESALGANLSTLESRWLVETFGQSEISSQTGTSGSLTPIYLLLGLLLLFPLTALLTHRRA